MRFLSPERSGCHILNLSKFSKVFHMTLWPEWEPLVQRGPGLAGTESCGCLCWRLGLMRRGYWWKHFWSETHNPSSFWSTFTLLDESQPSLVRAEQVHLLQTLPAYVSMLGFFSWLHNSSFITLIRTLGIHVQGYHGDAHFGRFLPTFPSTPTQHIQLSALDALAWDPSHFSVRCRVWTHPTQGEHPGLDRERRTSRTTINLTSLFHVFVLRNILKTSSISFCNPSWRLSFPLAGPGCIKITIYHIAQ